MRVLRVEIENFRGVAKGLVDFPGHALLLGPNNACKSTVLEALDLALGPDRVGGPNAIDEHDFNRGAYLPGAAVEGAEPTPPPTIAITVTLTRAVLRQHLQVSNQSRANHDPGPLRHLALELIRADERWPIDFSRSELHAQAHVDRAAKRLSGGEVSEEHPTGSEQRAPDGHRRHMPISRPKTRIGNQPVREAGAVDESMQRRPEDLPLGHGPRR
jgi:hypothetical protein